MARTEVQLADAIGKAANVEVKAVTRKKVSISQQIENLDQLVYERDYAKALRLLANILGVLERGEEGFGNGLRDLSLAAEREATIFCAAVTRMLSDGECKIGDENFFSLIPLKRSLMQAFEVSGYRGTDHLLKSIGRKDEAGDTVLNRQEIIKLLMGLSINALAPKIVDLLLRQPVNIAWPLCIAFLSEQIVWSKHGQTARPRILAASEFLSQAAPRFMNVRNVGPAYMGCSYDESVHKHQIKLAMNTVVRGFLDTLGVEDAKLPEARRAVKKRPTILIIAELYDSKHAMHRCYGPSIASLKRDFKVVLMTPSGKMDEALTDMFDKIDTTKFDQKNPKAFIDKAISYRPDIVYYPSIGMRMVSIACSTVRIAPIQLFTPGHPATTYSDKMDYMILVDGYVGDPNLVSEKILSWPSQPYFLMRDDAVKIAPKVKPASNVINVAVPAWSRKVTPQFLNMCAEINQRSKKQVKFHFFPNAVGSLLQGFSRRVSTIVPLVCHARTNYNQYVNILNECDLYLSTCPFGSTNGLVDGLRQGLPIVNLSGAEAHSKIDSDILNEAIQPGWLTAHNAEEYISAAVRLIDNDEERIAISRHILSVDIDKFLFVPEGNSMEDFMEVFHHAYQHHEHMMQSDQKVWDIASRRQLET